MSELLPLIQSPKDLRQLSFEKLPQLAQEVRDAILDVVAIKGGHLGASLGVVELTIALHYLFDTPNDLLVWDVGHQAYGHKILTERQYLFHTNRQLGGLSGFPKRDESIYDTFGTGHSSTSISAVLGMAIASNLNRNFQRQHIAVIGDASIASGMALEALNHLGDTHTNVWVILNDNAMGIDPSVGALRNHLLKSHSQNGLAELFNLKSNEAVDGHNLRALFEAIQKLKKHEGPKLLHVRTIKGKGLESAEQSQIDSHSVGKFDKKIGIYSNAAKEENRPPKYQDVFGKTLVELALSNEKIIGITPAMPTGTSLRYMMETLPERSFDVGIAEQHAVTFAAGLATQGMRPYCAFYSTFLQRAYDQVIHDVALQKLSVIFCIDRAGIVGQDGATHHGVFDLAVLNAIPNMIVAAPRNEIELRNLMYTAQKVELPMAIRYPRGEGSICDWEQEFKEIPIGKGECLSKGSEIALLSIGTMFLIAKQGIEKSINTSKASLYDLRFLKPLDEDLLHHIFQKHKAVITLEDGVLRGGLYSSILDFAARFDYTLKIRGVGVPDTFVSHGSIEELFEICKMDSSHVAALIDSLV